MADKDVGLDSDTFANEGVAADLAVISNFCTLLDFDERSYAGLVPDLATVKVYERVNSHISSELHVRRNPAIICK
jgi:hypothetical protein